MGFFSWHCPCCGHSIRSHHATNRASAWMASAVAVFKHRSIIIGRYDGYGRISGEEFNQRKPFALYHEACWNLAGKPAFTVPSGRAQDQGFFVGEYDPPKPTSLRHCKEMLVTAMAKHEADRAEAAAMMARIAKDRRREAEGMTVADVED